MDAQKYRGTSAQRYRDAEVRVERSTEAQRYRSTEVQKYRGTEESADIQGHRVAWRERGGPRKRTCGCRQC